MQMLGIHSDSIEYYSHAAYRSETKMRESMKYLIMVLVTMLCGCGSTLHLAKNRLEKSAVQLPVSKVFVSNPEKAYELELLEKSKIYQLVSKDKAEAILTIDRAGPVPFCANA